MAIVRCFANNENQSLYQKYHDYEWGRPTHNDNKLFEILSLESAQAGLKFETILKKREDYRNCFLGFDILEVSELSNNYLDSLLTRSSIIKNKLKIYSVKNNAEKIIDIQKRYGSFNNYIWKFVDHKPIINKWKKADLIPSSTALSDIITKSLKNRGFKFIGTTTIYAFMQASGLVCDHFKDCYFWNFK